MSIKPPTTSFFLMATFATFLIYCFIPSIGFWGFVLFSAAIEYLLSQDWKRKHAEDVVN